MYVNSNSSQNFGMALYMPKASKIERQLGKRLAKEAEIARPILSALAEDVDIIIKTSSHSNLAKKGFDIQVAKIEPNPIKRFLWGHTQYVEGSVQNSETYYNNMSDILVNKVANLKERFLRLNS